MHRIFLLSPAHPGGRRAASLGNPHASFELARALQRGETRTIGAIFQFLSGLYFRGKLSYTQTFGRPPRGRAAGYVITSNRGLLPHDMPTSLGDLRDFATTPIDARELRYLAPLSHSARDLASINECEFVLLGSISSDKYVEPLLPFFWRAPPFSN